MALWELDEFKPNQFLGYVRGVPTPPQFSGVRYLPNQVINDLAFEYVLGAFRRPVMAHVMGFDSEAPIHGRPGGGAKVSGELPPIKRKSRIGEKEIIRFLQPRAGTTDQQVAIDSVYDDTDALLDAVQARVEWLRMQALSEDTILYDEGGVEFVFDFGLDDELQINLVGANPTNGSGGNEAADFSTAWTDLANSNPVLDLTAICNRVQQKTGRRPEVFVTSQVGANLLFQNAAMKNMIRGTNAPDALLTQQEVNALFSLYNLPRVETYDTILQKEEADGTYSDVRPMAQNKSFLLPPGFANGNKTLWGPTAESRVLYGTPLAGQAPGIFAETYGTSEPPAEWVKAVATAFPTMPEANTIAQMRLF